MGIIIRGLGVLTDEILADVDDQATFGQNVRRLRQAMGLSQESLALRAGVDRSYLGSVERGQRNISLGGIAAIARALDVPAADLLSGIPVEAVPSKG